MNSFSSARRVTSCPPKSTPQVSQNDNTGSLTEQQKRDARRSRFSAGSDGTNSRNHHKKPINHLSYGFVSRGEDNRLQNSEQAQREYFDWILETFEQVESKESGSASGSGDKLDSAAKPDSKDKNSAELTGKSGSDSSEQVLTSLRKLREALLHEKPSEFSKKVHLFSVRVSSAVGHYQTYIPSIQYLLADADRLLTPGERSEIASILVLHVTHRNGSTSEGFRLFFKYLDPLKDSRVLQTVRAWALWDYHAWMNLYNAESDHAMFAVMTMGLQKVIQHMVSCFNVAYFTYSLEDLQKCLPKGMTWEDFKEKANVSWELEEGTVHIKRRQVRARGKSSSEKATQKA